MGQATVSVTFTRNLTNVRLVCSTSPALSNPLYSSYFSTTNYTAKLSITGLQPSTLYYYGIEINGALQSTGRGQFKTFPTEGTQSDLFGIFGSCARNNSNHAVFQIMKNLNPDIFIHLGDFHYMDIDTNDPQRYRDAFNMVFSSSNQADLYANVPTAYMWDDHDYGKRAGDNDDKLTASRPAAHLAYRERVPHYPLSGSSTPIYQSFVYGRVRIIMTDSHSDRDPFDQTDNDSKYLLGATQLQWFYNELLKPEPLKIWCNTQPFIGNGMEDTYWCSYPNERVKISNFIKQNNLSNRLFIVSGDMHGIAIDNGTNNNYATGGGPNFPVIQGGGFDQDDSFKGGPYTYGPSGSGGVGGLYGSFNVVDNGATFQIDTKVYKNSTVFYSHSFTTPGTNYSQPITDTTAPNDVTNLVASNITQTGVTLTWAASTSSDIASYDVYQGATLLGNTASTTFNVTGLTSGTNYTFTVKAKDLSNNVATGTNVSATPTALAYSYMTLNGTSDYVSFPSMTFTEVDFDVLVPSSLSGVACLMQGSAVLLNINTDHISSNSVGFSTYSPTVGTVFTRDVRMTITATASTATTAIGNLFAQSPPQNYFKGSVYGVTFKNGSTVVAQYDMTKGNWNDQSGNGRNATLVGGTWVTAPTVLFSDNFNRTANSASLGTSNSYAGGTNQNWTVVPNTYQYGIDSNGYAYANVLSSSSRNVAYADTGYSEGSAQVTLSVCGAGESPKLAFRIVDQDNMMVFVAASSGSYELGYYSGGVITTTNTISLLPKSGDVMKVVANGSTITCFVNGVQVLTTTSTQFLAATKWGINAYHYPNSRFDNFIITA